MIALGMAVSGLALAARGLRRGAARDEPGVGAKALAKAAGLLAILVAYLVAVPVAGYPIAVCALIAAAAFYAGARPGWALAASAAGGAAVFWVTFEWLLGIRLPAGVLAWF
jgi:cell division protein FtsW (lipid II flippase)